MKKPILDLMVDLETFSTNTDKGCVVSVGIKSFALPGRTLPAVMDLYKVINPQSSLRHGRIAEADTVAWWETKNAEAYAGLLSDIEREGGEYYRVWGEILNELRFWAETFTLHVWSKGIDFDFPLIFSSMRDAGLVAAEGDMPYRYYNKHDVRTVLHLAKRAGWEDPNVIIPHNALGDCHVQIIQLRSAIEYLNNGTQNN